MTVTEETSLYITLRRRIDPGLGPLDEKEATKGAGMVTSRVF